MISPTVSHTFGLACLDRSSLLVSPVFMYIADGVNLFGGEILNEIKGDDDGSVSSNKSIETISWQQLIALGTAIPACLLSILSLRCMSTKTLQVSSAAVV